MNVVEAYEEVPTNLPVTEVRLNVTPLTGSSGKSSNEILFSLQAMMVTGEFTWNNPLMCTRNRREFIFILFIFIFCFFACLGVLKTKITIVGKLIFTRTRALPTPACPFKKKDPSGPCYAHTHTQQQKEEQT